MQPELTLNTKCPACGTLKPKTLGAIKTLTAFACDCGFHAPIQQSVILKAESAGSKRKASATA